jgi:hypothetical protein
MRTIKTYSKRAPFYNAFLVTYLVRLPTSGLLARFVGVTSTRSAFFIQLE